MIRDEWIHGVRQVRARDKIRRKELRGLLGFKREVAALYQEMGKKSLSRKQLEEREGLLQEFWTGELRKRGKL